MIDPNQVLLILQAMVSQGHLPMVDFVQRVQVASHPRSTNVEFLNPIDVLVFETVDHEGRKLHMMGLGQDQKQRLLSALQA